MPKYWVEVPVTGKVCREIEADSNADAVDAALETPLTKEEKEDVEWETTRHVVQGNVFMGMLAHANAQLMKDQD